MARARTAAQQARSLGSNAAVRRGLSTRSRPPRIMTFAANGGRTLARHGKKAPTGREATLAAPLPFADEAIAASSGTNHLVPYFAIAGYLAYFLSGFSGAFLHSGSYGQALSWQVGSGLAITANVLIGVWLTRKGHDLAAAGFTIVGIVECVFFSSIVLTALDYRIMATGMLLTVPAMVLIAFCPFFPRWVRAAGLLMCVLFIVEYGSVAHGTHGDVDALQKASFIYQQTLGLIWSYYFWKEARTQA
jgi:hypothetical protein